MFLVTRQAVLESSMHVAMGRSVGVETSCSGTPLVHGVESCVRQLWCATHEIFALIEFDVPYFDALKLNQLLVVTIINAGNIDYGM